MGMLVDGKWQAEDLSQFARDGNQVRFDSGFHDIVAEGSEFPPGAGRYTLYLNWTCPWSHRASVTRTLKGLEGAVDLVLLEPAMGAQSWWFGESGNYADPAIGATHLHELYSATDDSFTGRVSVPVLWDNESCRIVNNDSGAIARMFNSAFNEFADSPNVDFYPSHLRVEIDNLNQFIAERLNDGVYRCLLAANQMQYELAYDALFEALDQLEEQLATRRYLLGPTPTEPDWRAFACLVRFDLIYYSLYGCNRKRIIDYPNLWAYTRDLYQIPGVSRTVDLEEIKRGYYGILDPGGIIPKGPELALDSAHDRDRL
ncbi:MAG: glutathione S-transferase family protein [Gammaproteobacteria bacterium]